MMRPADQVIARCRALAQYTEEPGFTTRTFLSAPMQQAYDAVGSWMTDAGLVATVDPAGNLRGRYDARRPNADRLYLGSHLDTVPRAGAFDGILGVVLAIELVRALQRRRLGFHIEIIGFSEEEGVRFGTPFIGSRIFAGHAAEELLSIEDSAGITVRQAIQAFGLDSSQVSAARADRAAIGFLEFHIEQGPVLDGLAYPVALVDGIVGQTRLFVHFHGKANHAGTTPMKLRHDAMAGAAEWILAVERTAAATQDMRATVGVVEVHPGAMNVIPGDVRVSLDARHADDFIREEVVHSMIRAAHDLAARRGLEISVEPQLDQASVAMDRGLTQRLQSAVEACGLPVHRMTSGAGHDAMVVARRMPAAMLFVRSPGGVSHHPDETVLPQDVAAAIEVGSRFLEDLEETFG
jgi:allantoate deiminase